MPNLQWEVPMRITSPAGEVILNVPDEDTGRVYQVLPDGYQIIPSLRVTADNISQADGSVLHARWKTGMIAQMTVRYELTESATDDNPVERHAACGLDLQEMHQHLMLVLNSIRTNDIDPALTQRYIWTPTGYGDDRLLDKIELLTWPTPSYAETFTSVTFTIESPFPYAIDATEIETEIGVSASDFVENAGNCDESPVVKVFGPTAYFELTNYDDLDELGNPKKVVYDASLPGGVSIGPADYAEIGFFNGTIFLNGSGANLIAALSPTATDFWQLKANTNNLIGILGASATVLSNNAWT